ncbi:Hypothetical predicted protein [Octopus vulgaris]|uniref:Uncharacterized protein n=1 Tax=Octopus vulgaris TaxID=6645 RepID=A0AA36B3L0_OCTVU|nr:Hypothetical predicted protein [Octopus vulgaris]
MQERERATTVTAAEAINNIINIIKASFAEVVTTNELYSLSEKDEKEELDVAQFRKIEERKAELTLPPETRVTLATMTFLYHCMC